MVLEIGSHVTTMTEIYTIMTMVHYRLSNGAGSKKEILVCGLFLSMQGAMNDDKRECIVPSVALLASN